VHKFIDRVTKIKFHFLLDIVKPVVIVGVFICCNVAVQTLMYQIKLFKML